MLHIVGEGGRVGHARYIGGRVGHATHIGDVQRLVVRRAYTLTARRCAVCTKHILNCVAPGLARVRILFRPLSRMKPSVSHTCDTWTQGLAFGLLLRTHSIDLGFGVLVCFWQVNEKLGVVSDGG
jgi:hypothetical protein